jgi:hypothetical protein
MHHRIRGLRPAGSPVVVVLVALLLSACGSSGGSGDAQTLLKETFGGGHKVDSGRLAVSVAVTPSGSRTLTSPITLSFGGPFQSRGAGKLPQSNFQISLGEQSRRLSVGLISTGTAGYVTLAGASYRLPAASFQRLEQSFAQVAGAPGGSGGAASKLGVDPLRWVHDPTVVGTEDVAGTRTTHIRAGIDVSALLDDLNRFLARASSLGVSGAGRLPSSLSPATRSRIAAEVSSPRVDVWTGTGDKTVRKLQVRLTLPVTGQASALLGGLRSIGIALSMSYAGLNQPQSVQAPVNVRPYGEFSAKLRLFISAVQSGVLSPAR